MLIRGCKMRLDMLLADEDLSYAFRNLLIGDSPAEARESALDGNGKRENDLPLSLFIEMHDLLETIADDPYSRQYMTMLYLDDSLCPMHHCDYAICFDDENPECAVLREYFPDHDT